jgi:hypothetical protein
MVAPFEQAVVSHPPIDHLWQVAICRQFKPGVRYHIAVDVPPVTV